MSKIGKIRKIIKNPKKKYICCRVGGVCSFFNNIHEKITQF